MCGGFLIHFPKALAILSPLWLVPGTVLACLHPIHPDTATQSNPASTFGVSVVLLPKASATLSPRSFLHKTAAAAGLFCLLACLHCACNLSAHPVPWPKSLQQHLNELTRPGESSIFVGRFGRQQAYPLYMQCGNGSPVPEHR